MAWVHLSDLLATDKNFYGLIDPNWSAELKISDWAKPHLSKDGKRLIAPWLEGQHTLQEFATDGNIDEIEWCLETDGRLIQHTDGLVKIDGKYQFPAILTIDIANHLRALPDATLQRIAELGFGWRHDGKDKQQQFLDHVKHDQTE